MVNGCICSTFFFSQFAQANPRNAHVVLCLSLTPLTPSTDVNAPGLICSLTQQQPPFFLGPFDGNTCPHVCGLSVVPSVSEGSLPPSEPLSRSLSCTS